MAASNRVSQGFWLAAGAVALGLAALVIQQGDEDGESFWAPLLAPPKPQAISIIAAATIARAPQELLDVWKNAEILPLILRFVHTVEPIDELTKRWNLRGSLGASLALDVKLISDGAPNRLAWTLTGDGVEGELTVEATADGTAKSVLSVALALRAPVRPDAPTVALDGFFGEAPATRLTDDLRRLGVGLERGLLKV